MNEIIILLLVIAVLYFVTKQTMENYRFSDPFYSSAKEYCENTYKGKVSVISVNGKDKGVCVVPPGVGLGLETKMCDLETLVLAQACVAPF